MGAGSMAERTGTRTSGRRREADTPRRGTALAAALCAAGLLSPAVLSSQSLPAELASVAREGLEARSEGRHADAAEAFLAITEAVPDFVPGHLNLGFTRHEQQRYADASRAFQAALSLDPTLKGVRGLLGFDLVSSGDFGAAVGILTEAEREEPGRPETAYALGLAYLRTGQYEEAVDWLERALKQSPDHAELLRLAAEAHLGLAGAMRGRLVESAPTSTAALIVRAQQATVAGLYADAIEIYEQAERREPRQPDIRLPLGDLYLEREDYVRAEEMYRRELEMRPNSARAAERLGEALLLLGRGEDARGRLEQATRLDPTSLSARSLLGKALTDTGDLEGAEKVLASVLESAPEGDVAARTHYQLALIYRKTGRTDQAVEHLQRFQQIRAEMAGAESP